MVSFDLSFRSMLIKEIVENEGELWSEVSITWLSINRVSYHGKRLQVVYVALRPFFGVLSSAAYPWVCYWSISSVWLIFWVF